MVAGCKGGGFCDMISFFINILCFGAFRAIPDPSEGFKFVTVRLHDITVIDMDDRLVRAQDSLYVTDCYFAPVSHRHTYLASTQSVTQKHWRFATRFTGDYLGQTFTGKLITACRTHDFHP